MRPTIDMNLMTDKNADVLRLILANDVSLGELAELSGTSQAGVQYHITILLDIYKVRTRRQLRRLFAIEEPKLVEPKIILRRAGEVGRRFRA